MSAKESVTAAVSGAVTALGALAHEHRLVLYRLLVQRGPEGWPAGHLAEQLGCEFCEKDGYIQCGEDAATCVPGVYAAGNASRGVQLVIAAAAEGMQAAFAINTALIDADAETGALKNAGEAAAPAP